MFLEGMFEDPPGEGPLRSGVRGLRLSASASVICAGRVQNGERDGGYQPPRRHVVERCAGCVPLAVPNGSVGGSACSGRRKLVLTKHDP